MSIEFGNVEIGEHFSYNGNNWQKVNEFQALNLHNLELFEFQLNEVVISFGELK